MRPLTRDLPAAFLKRFGVLVPGTTDQFVIPAEWQSALSNGSAAGGIIGLFINVSVVPRFMSYD